MISPVDIHFTRVFLQAEHSAPVDAGAHVLVAVRCGYVRVEDHLFLFIQYSLYLVVVLAREFPCAHREVLQDFQAVADSILNSH